MHRTFLPVTERVECSYIKGQSTERLCAGKHHDVIYALKCAPQQLCGGLTKETRMQASVTSSFWNEKRWPPEPAQEQWKWFLFENLLKALLAAFLEATHPISVLTNNARTLSDIWKSRLASCSLISHSCHYPFPFLVSTTAQHVLVVQKDFSESQLGYVCQVSSFTADRREEILSSSAFNQN